MTTEMLFSFVALHTYLALAAGACFYMSMLESANRHRVRVKRLHTYAFLSLITALLAWGLKLTMLRDYFQGKAGIVTDASISPNVSLFEVVQAYAFPIVILFSIMLVFIVWKDGHEIEEKQSVRHAVLYVSFVGFALSAVLMFLGVLIP